MTILTALMTFFNPTNSFSQSERMDLTAHRDAWLAKRNSRLEKTVKYYSY